MTKSARRIAVRVAELIDQRRPFVQATVVRAQCPTSARPGDSAVVLSDGTIEGFVGGRCAEGSVRVAALDAIERDEAVLLRILPAEHEEFPEGEGARTVINPCLSGGALEIYLEPKLPASGIVIVGQTPIAAALADFGQSLGCSVETAFNGPSPEAGTSGVGTSGVGTSGVGTSGVEAFAGATAVIIASHGRHEPEAIRAALDAGVGFIGLVASAARGAAVIDELELSTEEKRRVRSPVGVRIGAKTAEEIALSILADVVRAIRIEALVPAPSLSGTGTGTDNAAAPATAIDPVCNMTVVVDDATPKLTHEGTDYWFCNAGCQTRFAEELEPR